MTSDHPQLPQLTSRQEEILSFIVRAYTDAAEPVSSNHLVKTYNLTFSSATVRNEMSVLEELGYITAPHTSAGRVPTENGYRYFVKYLTKDHELPLPSSDRTYINEKLQSTPLATEQWMRLVATVMARTAQTAALVTPPSAETSRFKHVELIAIQGRMALMVLVLQSGVVHQQMLTLAEPVTQETLSAAAMRTNGLFPGLTAQEIRMKSVQLRLLEQDIAELAADMMDMADRNQARQIYRDGLSDVIGNFSDNEGAQQAIRVFEESGFLNVILAEVLTPLINNVQVVIAGDGQWEQLSHLSMVLSRYGIPGQVSGTVGVLGPTNINYGRAISTVSYVSQLMSSMLHTLYVIDDIPPTNDDE